MHESVSLFFIWAFPAVGLSALSPTYRRYIVGMLEDAATIPNVVPVGRHGKQMLQKSDIHNEKHIIEKSNTNLPAVVTVGRQGRTPQSNNRTIGQSNTAEEEKALPSKVNGSSPTPKVIQHREAAPQVIQQSNC